ncbi:MAG TPA: hypothetical protein VGQ76_11865 [Thermoanaerobaculia bacterium]|nr:hypothetical protein [Thermoanaerobaculia bacterium]
MIGDWDGDGFDTVGVFRDNGATPPVFFLTNAHVVNTFGKVDIQFFIPDLASEGSIPVAGDWDGDGVDTIGFYRPEPDRCFRSVVSVIARLRATGTAMVSMASACSDSRTE